MPYQGILLSSLKADVVYHQANAAAAKHVSGA